MFEVILSKIKVILKSSIILFVYGILSKWYVAMTIAALVVTFWVFKGLQEAGVIQAAEKVVFKAFDESKAVAKHCMPKIANISEFWKCVENPPAYKPTEEEKKLEKGLTDLLNIDGNTEKPTETKKEEIKDPYEE